MFHLVRNGECGTGVIVSENGYIVTNQHLAGKVGTRVIVNLEKGNQCREKSCGKKKIWMLPLLKLIKNN